MHHVLPILWLTTIFGVLALARREHSSNQAKKAFNLETDHSRPLDVHLRLYRRSGRYAKHKVFNLTGMRDVLSRSEKRYLRTSTVAVANRIVRQWHKGSDGDDEHIFEGAGQSGNWYTIMKIGNPPQEIEVDVDMLSPDFHFVITSSGQGVKYDVFSSTSRKTSNEHAHALCPISYEALTMQSSGEETSINFQIPICQPNAYSLQTLSNSGAVLGLSPSGQFSTLSRLSSSSLLSQLLEQSLIEHDIFSLTLLDSETGILSLGGSIAPEIEEAKIRIEKELAYIGGESRAKMEDEIKGAMAFAIPPGSTHEQHFKWTDVGSGAVASWHMTLVTGIWVNGVKVLKNQPALFDVNCPFILAPPGVVDTVYQAIPGGRTLSSLLDKEATSAGQADNFYAFPCLNEVDISFEIAGWRFPFGKSELAEDAIHGPFGGRFSLGQVDISPNGTASEQRVRTGYCAGIIVKSMMGVRPEASRSALRDVWVLGEPFFRGLGVAFDMGGKRSKIRVGLRIY